MVMGVFGLAFEKKKIKEFTNTRDCKFPNHKHESRFYEKFSTLSTSKIAKQIPQGHLITTFIYSRKVRPKENPFASLTNVLTSTP